MRWIAGLLFLLVFPAYGWAQTGKISGTVRDVRTGETLPGVNVVIVGTTQGTSTDVEGYFTILNVRPGTYEVRASFIGFAAQTTSNVRVTIDRTTQVDFRLREESFVGEEVVVVAERPIVQRDLTSSSASVSGDQLRVLPVQNFQEVVNLQAGVSEGHFRGGRLGEVAYLVDGIPVNDAFDGRLAFQVENNAIQEIEIISGTFNAEYGQAQSGVVSIVTRDGGASFQGSLSAQAGTFATGESGLFPQANRIPGSTDLQGTLSGPLWGDRITFFASGRTFRDDGHLYGQRIVQPVYNGQQNLVPVSVHGRSVLIPSINGAPAWGDSAWVPMAWNEQHTAQLKLTARPWRGGRITASGLVQRDRGQDYDPQFRYMPDGRPTRHGAAWSGTAALNHVFGSTTVFDARFAHFVNEVDVYRFEDPLDERQPWDEAFRVLGGNFAFYRGGSSMLWSARQTATSLFKADLSRQVNRRHLVKTGFQLTRHQLSLDEFQVKRNATTGFLPAIPQAGTPDRVRYTERPVEASAYVQDKMEFDYLVVNVGVRFDYFDARSRIPADFDFPLNGETTPTSAKWQISPRVGVAFPLSERGIVHIAYGHFFQMPPFSFLFTNPDYRYNPELGLSRPFGYANLEPEQTVAYEIGLQQGVTDDIGLFFTVYAKNIRNLLGTRLETLGPDQDFALSRYGRFVNVDYGQVRGIIASFEKRPSDGVGVRLDYTFQVAQGNASDPRDFLADEQSGREPEKQLAPLDWDRRHQLNAQVTVGSPAEGIGLFSLVGRAGSGLPYSPSSANQRLGVRNGARKPGSATFDVFYTRRLKVGGMEPGLFLRMYNVLDSRIVRDVYADTGRPQPNLRLYSGQPMGLNTLEEFILRPDFYAPPRMVQVGLSIDF